MNRGLEATSPSFVRGCVNVLRKAIRRLHRTNRDVPELRWELAEIFGRIESSRTEEIRSIDSWTRNEAEELVRITNSHEPRYDTRRSLYASGRAPGLDRSLEGAVNPQLFLDDVTATNDLHRIDGIPGAILDRFTCAVDPPGVSDRVDYVIWSTPAGYTAFPYCRPLSPTSGALPFGRITAQFHKAGTGVLRNYRHDE